MKPRVIRFIATQFVAIPLLAALVLFSAALQAEVITNDPASALERVTKRIFSKLSENMDEYTENPEALQDLVRTDLMPIIDVQYSARLILGRAGRGLEKQKIDEFAEAMSNLLVNRYAKGLLYFKSLEQLQILPIRGELNEKFTRVRTRIKLPEGGYAPIDYAFHMTTEGWKAFDIIVEGISYVTTYRNQIMPDVLANGIDSVIASLSNGDLDIED